MSVRILNQLGQINQGYSRKHRGVARGRGRKYKSGEIAERQL